MKKKYAIYARVSLKDDSQTTENQIVRLKEYAQSKNWEYDIFEEQESSRKTRPIKADLLRRLRNHESLMNLAARNKIRRVARQRTPR